VIEPAPTYTVRPIAALYFTLTGKIKPYVRMTQRGKFVKKNAQEYLASKEAIRWQLRQQMEEGQMLPERTPLAVCLVFNYDGGFHNRDLDNTVKAALDAAQGIVFPDDRWVDVIYAKRVRMEQVPEGALMTVWKC